KQGRQVEKNRLGNEDGANGLIVQRLPKSSIAPRNIYHLPSGVVRRPKRIELPATPFQRVLTGDLPMDTIYEYPRLSRSKARALEVIRRGETLRRDHSYSISASFNFRQSDPTSSVNIAVRF
ncbi:hypothetical protein, partial [Pseudomonas meliae]|uniref:hypothetical protein n=1 Tax=Pseudomonas meliae TaxID=86176 RepID=UPI001F1755B6